MQYELYWVDLTPTKGAEINNRPCVVISPDEMNNYLKTIIVAPITSTYRPIPTRVEMKDTTQNGLKNKSYIVLDQIKCIDKLRLSKLIGKLTESEAKEVSKVLCQMFAYS